MPGDGTSILMRRGQRMCSRGWIANGACLIGLGLVAFLVIAGCGDSRTTGTQVQMSPEVKAEIQDMKGAMRELRSERKAERKKERGTPKKKR
jgi:hypothetical protein